MFSGHIHEVGTVVALDRIRPRTRVDRRAPTPGQHL